MLIRLDYFMKYECVAEVRSEPCPDAQIIAKFQRTSSEVHSCLSARNSILSSSVMIEGLLVEVHHGCLATEVIDAPNYSRLSAVHRCGIGCGVLRSGRVSPVPARVERDPSGGIAPGSRGHNPRLEQSWIASRLRAENRETSPDQSGPLPSAGVQKL